MDKKLNEVDLEEANAGVSLGRTLFERDLTCPYCKTQQHVIVTSQACSPYQERMEVGNCKGFWECGCQARIYWKLPRGGFEFIIK